MEPLKGRGVLSTPICVKKEGNAQASANQGFSTASQGSYHVHGTPCCPFVSKRREMPKPVPTRDFLQPAKAAAMCTAAPKKAEKPYLCPFVSKKREMPKPVLARALLQPSAKAAAMCTAPRAAPLADSQPRQLPCAEHPVPCAQHPVRHPVLKPPHLPLSHFFC